LSIDQDFDSFFKLVSLDQTEQKVVEGGIDGRNHAAARDISLFRAEVSQILLEFLQSGGSVLLIRQRVVMVDRVVT